MFNTIIYVTNNIRIMTKGNGKQLYSVDEQLC